jgi:hypothetical protein
VIESFNSSDMNPWPKLYGLVKNKTKLQALASRAQFWLTMTDTTTFATDTVKVDTECMICTIHYICYWTTSTALDYKKSGGQQLWMGH